MPRKKKTTTVVTQVTKTAAQPQSAGGKGGKKKNKTAKKKQEGLHVGNLRKFFREAILRPDLTGPIRQPRFGGSTRTGLGMDQTLVTLVGDSTNTVQIIQAGIPFSQVSSAGSYKQWKLANTSTTLGTAQTANSTLIIGGPNVQFPAAAQVADVNLTGCSMVCYYTGNPLSVQGEVMLNRSILLHDLATYASLYQGQGTVKVPLATLIEKPLAVSFAKLSAAADEFIPTTSASPDLDMPWIAMSGAPQGGTLVVEIFRTWEYRSTTQSGYVIPYEKVGNSHAAEADLYQDARADTALMPSPVTPAVPDGGWMSTVGNMMGVLGGGAGAALAAWQMHSQRHVRRVRDGRAIRTFGVFDDSV
jgi:hypothetical protein